MVKPIGADDADTNVFTILVCFKMWYNGVDTTTWKINIGLATSNDGINWSKYANNPVVTTGNWGTYDDMWLGTPTVLAIDNYYEIWYAATASSSYNFSTSSFDTVSICYATSIDGISWIKHFNNPLFNTYTLPYDSLVDRGVPWASCVIYNHNTNNYMMWYEAHGGNANYTFSLATAPRTNTSITEYYQADYNIFPNPMSSSTTIRSVKIFENATLQIFNSIGQSVLLIERVNGKEIEIKKGNKNCRLGRLFKGCSPLQFMCNLTGNRPQSATFHSAKRYAQLIKTHYEDNF